MAEKAGLKLIERRFGEDGMEYFAQWAGPYDGVYWWFVWRVPTKGTSGVGELIGKVMNRANSEQEAEDSARALLVSVVP